MKTTINAIYSDGKFTPVFDVGLEEGVEVTLTIESVERRTMEERIAITKSTAGSLKGLYDPEEFKRAIYEARKTGSRIEPAP